MDYLGTSGGQRFASAVTALAKHADSIPDLVKSIDRLSKELHEANRLKKIELKTENTTEGLFPYSEWEEEYAKEQTTLYYKEWRFFKMAKRENEKTED